MISFLDHKAKNKIMYRTVFDDGNLVIWKPLPWELYQRYREAMVQTSGAISGELEERVFHECVLYSSFDPVDVPPNIKNKDDFDFWRSQQLGKIPYGVVSSVASVILKTSGTSNPYRIQEQINIARSRISLFDQMIALICKELPGHTPDELKMKTFEEIIELLLYVEMMTGHSVDLDFSTPEDELAAQKKKMDQKIQQIHEMGGAWDPEADAITEDESQIRRERRLAVRGERDKRMAMMNERRNGRR